MNDKDKHFPVDLLLDEYLNILVERGYDAETISANDLVGEISAWELGSSYWGERFISVLEDGLQTCLKASS